MRREKKSRPEVRGERKSNKKQYFGLPFLSVPLQICNGTDKNGIILAHIQHLMGGIFCVWCGKCAKYLAFGTFATSTVGALNICKFYVKFTINSMCLDPDEPASDVLRFFFLFLHVFQL